MSGMDLSFEVVLEEFWASVGYDARVRPDLILDHPAVKAHLDAGRSFGFIHPDHGLCCCPAMMVAVAELTGGSKGAEMATEMRRIARESGHPIDEAGGDR